MSLRILLADDHCIVRQGLRALLERAGFDVVGEAADGLEAVRLAESLTPDAVVLDLIMPTLNGLDAGRQILVRQPAMPILLLTMHTEEAHVAAALRAGIRGYLLKTQAADDLARAIRDVVRGHLFLSAAVARVVVDGYVAGTAPAQEVLAPRERQVLQLVAEGHTSKAIAAKLELSVKTVESYRARVMEKVGVHETAGLVRYAIRNGVIVP
jgi:DNA-binding NarL/FixJ family response regulator